MIAYVDMVGGAAGDMLLAAFLDAGVDRAAVEDALRTVVPAGWSLAPERVVRCGIAATFAGLVVPGEDGDPEHRHGHHRHGTTGGERRLRDVLAVVDASGLSARQRERASAVYRRLAKAEARVHGSHPDAIHFHEVGQVDAILDVAATCVCLDLLEIERLVCSPFPIGRGPVAMHHGTYPNPPPATADLLRGFPLRPVEVDGELVTTTAAAILSTLASPGPLPPMVLERIGYGAGRSDFPIPNVTRVLVGSAVPEQQRHDDEVAILEANIDDMSPQHYEIALERIFAAGARDAWLTPIVMKKGRPAILLAALAASADETAVANAMLRETTTIGVRVRREHRHVAAREVALVDTPLGKVRVKRATVAGRLREQPEYDDVARIAREHGLPVDEVLRGIAGALRERTVT